MKAGVTLTTNLLFKILVFVVVMIIVIILVLVLKGKSLDVFEFIKEILQIAF